MKRYTSCQNGLGNEMTKNEQIAALTLRAESLDRIITQDTEREVVLKEEIAKRDATPDFARGFQAGKDSVLRKNMTGCCCKWDDDDERIVSLCAAHKEYISEQIAALTTENKKLTEELSNHADARKHLVEQIASYEAMKEGVQVRIGDLEEQIVTLKDELKSLTEAYNGTAQADIIAEQKELFNALAVRWGKAVREVAALTARLQSHGDIETDKEEIAQAALKEKR